MRFSYEEAWRRAESYLRLLGIAEHDVPSMTRDVLALIETASDGTVQAGSLTAAVRRVVPPEYLPPSESGAAWCGTGTVFFGEETSGTRVQQACHRAGLLMPPLKRQRMLLHKYRLSLGKEIIMRLARLLRRVSVYLMSFASGKLNTRWKSPKTARPKWERAAQRRRLTLIALVIFSTAALSCASLYAIPWGENIWLWIASVCVFTVLSAWNASSFWTGVMGFVTAVRHPQRYSPIISGPRAMEFKNSGFKTAIVMPIKDEDVKETYSNIETMYAALKSGGFIEGFDFFILSDTADPDRRVEEKVQWNNLCERTGGFKRIFYRNRKTRIKRKSGNIADFCRRWGALYRYMIVLDADSLMTPYAVTSLVGIMEQNPRAGIVQTIPRPFNQATLYSRAYQFAGHAYLPLFVAGLQFWQLGDAESWGHNAIIRIEPFVKYCSLPRLSGPPPLGGEILSHDFVESALMRRAGWEVWLWHEGEGSFEQLPPDFIDDVKRERRWCQGNMQHLKVLFWRGISFAHRLLFFHGTMSYISSLLWFVFLIASSASVAAESLNLHDYFAAPHSLFPVWKIHREGIMPVILFVTAVYLFTPKILGVILIASNPSRVREFGGMWRLCVSALGEIVFSSFVAPIRMMFHAKFVAAVIFGIPVSWDPQKRRGEGVGWRDAFGIHKWQMLIALLWGGFFFLVNREFLLMLLPVIVPLILAVPFTVVTSKESAGAWFKKAGIFLSSPETFQDPVIRERNRIAARRDEKEGVLSGFARLVVDPFCNTFHRIIASRKNPRMASIHKRRELLVQKASASGPGVLTAAEKSELIRDQEMLSYLHDAAWNSLGVSGKDVWGIQKYINPNL